MTFIHIGGAIRPFRFGFNAIDIFCRERKITLAQFAEQLERLGSGGASPGELRDIIFAGLAGGALTQGQQIAFSNLHVGDWMDELPAGELAKIVEALADSVTAPDKKKEKVTGAKP